MLVAAVDKHVGSSPHHRPQELLSAVHMSVKNQVNSRNGEVW